MKAYINYTYKVVYVQTDSVGRACSVGLAFMRDHPNLEATGWSVYCVPCDLAVAREDRREVHPATVAELADRIREGPPPPPCTHSCPRHPPVGIEGYQVVG